MSRCIYYGSLYFVVLALGVALACAAEPAADKKTEDKSAKSTPAVQTIKKGPLRITLEWDGVFAGETAHEIAVRPEEWSKLTVLSAAPHGARVRKDDVLLELDTEKLDRAIADLRAELKVSELAFQQNQEQLRALEKTTPLDLEVGQRAARVAEEDLKYFFDVTRPRTLKATEFSLKSAKARLEYQREELRQLEKMYKADDITEETEEIVLKRARDALERVEFATEGAQMGHDKKLKFDIPRKDEQTKESARRESLKWDKSKVTIPLALQKKRWEMEKLQLKRSKTEDKLNRLLADRQVMTVRSPAEGIVYHGKFTQGKVGNSAALADVLRSHGVIRANQVVMTVVSPRPMCIRATVPESQLHDLRPGVKGTATPVGYPNVSLPVEIDNVSDIPISPGKFDARLTVQLKKGTKLLMPGMTCKVKLVPYQKKDAITVPPKAVITDEWDDQKQSVQVLEKDGKIKNRPVTVGRKTDKQVEILKGLSEGEQVVIKPAKDRK